MRVSGSVLLAVVAAAAVGVMGNAVGPIPRSVFRKETYAAASGCTGDVLGVESAPVNWCSYSDRNSTMYAIGAGGNLTRITWAAGWTTTGGSVGMCTGAYATPTPSGDGELTTASGACVGGNVKYTYPVTDPGQQWGTQTLYRDPNCNEPLSGPVSFRLGACLADGAGNSFRYTLSADFSQFIKNTWTGSTKCVGTPAEDLPRYGNQCLALPPGRSFSFQYTPPFSSTAGTVPVIDSSSTGSNGAGAVRATALLPAAAVAAALLAVAAL